MSSTALDRLLEKLTRQSARRSSRRSFLGGLGAWLTGAAVLPLLPFDRRGYTEARAEGGAAQDDSDCSYWRYCSIDGNLCTCCGGGTGDCPPGTSKSPTAWIGSCLNPQDQQLYLIHYHDCCGRSNCDRCFCHKTEGEMPIYRQGLNSEIIWCFGARNMVYNCTGAVVLGKAG
ncbi:MAG: hypothetical protein K1X75_08220 [Leptospirales bacterium]|nr:hypothetical protein [Leptospirales bacterium]